MSLFNSFTLTVKRKQTDGGYVDGRWVEGTSDPTFTIQTSWQPAGGKDLKVLEEGMRQASFFKAYPATQLYTVDPKTNQEADIIVGPDGFDYEVVYVGPWQNNLISHYKILVRRIKEGA